MITVRHIRKAIKAAKTGQLNGFTYSQKSWCGTKCCVLGFARHIAKMPPAHDPKAGEIEDTTDEARILRLLMWSTTPRTLDVMDAVRKDGRIDLRKVSIRAARAAVKSSEQNSYLNCFPVESELFYGP